MRLLSGQPVDLATTVRSHHRETDDGEQSADEEPERNRQPIHLASQGVCKGGKKNRDSGKPDDSPRQADQEERNPADDTGHGVHGLCGL